MRASSHGARRHGDRRNDLAGFEHGLDVRRVPGQPVKLGQRHRAVSACPTHLYGCIEGNERHREVGRIGGNAVLARAEHGIPAILATNGGTAGAGRALVAGRVADIAKIGATGALEEVAPHRGLIAHLRARRVQERLGNNGKLLDDCGVSRHVRHRRGGTEPQALRSDLDAPVEKAREADEPIGRRTYSCRSCTMSVPPAMYSTGASLRPAWARKTSAAATSRGRSRVKGCMAQPPRTAPLARAASWMARTM